MQSHDLELYLDSTFSSNGLTPLEYTKRYDTWEDLFESDQWKEIFRGYQIREMWNRQTAYQKYEFIGAYLVPVDPDTNYGKSFTIYVQYLVEGIRHLQKVSVSLALTNSNFVRVVILDTLEKIYITNSEVSNHPHSLAKEKNTQTILYKK